MKRIWTILAIVAAMVGLYVGMREMFIYYAERPLDVSVSSLLEEVEETEEVLQFIRTTHESLNGFLNFGKADAYTDEDWELLRTWFQEQEPALQRFSEAVQDEKIKRDVTRSYEIMKLGVETGNIQYVVYGHRIYHDLDILIGGYTGETNIWDFTEVANGKNVQAVEAILSENKR